MASRHRGLASTLMTRKKVADWKMERIVSLSDAAEARPLSLALGAEIHGLDLRALDADAIAWLQEHYRRHSLLLFRNSDLNEAETEHLVGHFGPLVDEAGDGRRTGYVSNVMENCAGEGPLPFHSDFSFTRLPVQGIALHAIALPQGGTSTWFASGVRAAETLPPDLRGRIEPLSAVHALSFTTTTREGTRTRDIALPAHAPRFSHPILRIHPRTGQTVLYLTDLHVERIEGVDEARGAALIDELFAHLYQPRHLYEHRWRLGDLVVWDNEAIQHMRADVADQKPRTFRRNTLHTARMSELISLGDLSLGEGIRVKAG